jgi:hypothetical protein
MHAKKIHLYFEFHQKSCQINDSLHKKGIKLLNEKHTEARSAGFILKSTVHEPVSKSTLLPFSL